MNVTLTERGKRERSLIDIAQPEDLKYWTEQFGATPKELQAAVRAAGADVDAVEAYLKKHKV
jgi:hypothetical protein